MCTQIQATSMAETPVGALIHPGHFMSKTFNQSNWTQCFFRGFTTLLSGFLSSATEVLKIAGYVNRAIISQIQIHFLIHRLHVE